MKSPKNRFKRKPIKPDEVFEAPGFRMERRGRFTSVQSHRSPGEHKRWIKHLVDTRPLLLDKIQEATQELVDLVHKFNSLELLAQVWFHNSVGDPNEYKEYSFEGRLPYVEHLALLELRDAEYKVHTLQIPNGAEIEKAQQLLDTIFSRTVFYYGTEGLDPEQIPSISRIEQLRFDSIMHELVVRSPTYYSHCADILEALFSRPPVSEWISGTLGFHINDALKLIQTISDLMMARLRKRREEAVKFAAELQGHVVEFKSTGRFSGPKDLKDVVNRIRNMRGKEAKRAIKSIAVSWTFHSLHETVSFTPSELAQTAGLDPIVAESFLKSFSLQFGAIPSDYLLPQPASALRLRPIIKFEDRYFCSAAHLLIWAIKPQIERLLKPGAPEAINADVRLWERYQRYRSDFLIDRSLKYFLDLLPRAKTYQKLRYRTAEGGIEKFAELDGLVLFDRYAFLLEAKAGEISPSARRGGKLRLVSDLKELVEEPHRQASRAMTYISGNDSPMFELEDGTILNLEKKVYRQFFVVTPTLENLDVFTKELYQLREIGIFGTAELPWAVSLDDLRIIAETIRLPSQFTHYLKWRLYLNQSGKIVAQSELDWLGYYLVEGPKLLVVPEGYSNLALQTYTTDFDDFYLYEQGERTVPAPRPSQFCPREVLEILASIEQLGGYGFTGVAEAVLTLNFEERELLAQGVREIWGVSRGLGLRAREVVGERVVVVLRETGEAKEDLDSLARSMAETKGKTAVVLVLSSGKPHKVAAWGLYEVSR